MTWFKARQKAVGLTSFDLGEAIGRDRSVISRLANGTQRMTLDQARILADLLKVPLAEMIERAGLGDRQVARDVQPGFAEGDAAPFAHGPGLAEAAQTRSIAQLLGERPGVDVWQVRSPAMQLAGLVPGDMMLVDTHAAERVRPGDVVVAQVYGRDTASTVLRRFDPPVLVAAGCGAEKVHVVDGVNVVIRGKVVASWRV